jgi:hypothetical protein
LTRETELFDDPLDNLHGGMPHTIMPFGERWSEDTEGEFGWKRVETLPALPFKKKTPRVSVLYQEKLWVKLKKHIVIKC